MATLTPQSCPKCGSTQDDLPFPPNSRLCGACHQLWWYAEAAHEKWPGWKGYEAFKEFHASKSKAEL